MSGQQALAQWWRDVKRTNNEAFLPLFFDEHRYLVLMGGGGSGKSIFAARKALERCVSEEGHRFLVVRKVARTIRQSCWRNLLEQLGEYYPKCGYRANKTDMVISFPNGSEILFAGLDDVEKLKSIQSITSIWIEEASEVLETDFDQLDIRLRGETRWYKQIILSFNPVSLTSWLKARFFDRSDPRVKTHRSTYRDNRFLPKEDVATLEAFRVTNPYYYQVYALGEWGVTGKTVFDAGAVSERLRHIPRPVRQGYYRYGYDGLKITDIRWTDDPEGEIRIYLPPQAGVPYVVGGDTAGDGSDYFVGQVLDNRTGEQAAVLRKELMDEDEYARQIYCLGMAYNQALVALEANFSTYPVKELQRLGYTRQYIRERSDTYTGEHQKSFGFRTDRLTRPEILGGLIEVLRGHYDVLNDETTLQEMLTFVRTDKQRMEAAAGAHDDCVMALAIAFHARGQQIMTVKPPEPVRKKWTQDMWEDYYGAGPKERERLIEAWGQPM